MKENPDTILSFPTALQKKAIGRTRWWIVWTLFFSTVTNYISRQTFSVLSPVIVSQFHLSHAELGKILGAFQISYAITWLAAGMLLDIIGTRYGLVLAAAGWSVVNMLTGFANSVFAFASFRFLLGIGEGFNWPGASKAVAEWFPRQERSLAVAIFDSGSSVGGALAALLVPWVALALGWRWASSSPACSGSFGLRHGCTFTILLTVISASVLKKSRLLMLVETRP